MYIIRVHLRLIGPSSVIFGNEDHIVMGSVSRLSDIHYIHCLLRKSDLPVAIVSSVSYNYGRCDFSNTVQFLFPN